MLHWGFSLLIDKLSKTCTIVDSFSRIVWDPEDLKFLLSPAGTAEKVDVMQKVAYFFFVPLDAGNDFAIDQ